MWMHNRWKNLCGLGLAFVLAAGGLLSVQWLMEEKKEMLLARDGEKILAEKEMQEQAEDITAAGEDGQNQSKLTGDALVQAVLCLKSNGELFPHEPYAGQLSMEEAAHRGRLWLETFEKTALGKAENEIDYMKINARLCRKEVILTGDEEAERQIKYSYWLIEMKGAGQKANLVLDAGTGQVLDADMMFFYPGLADRVIDAEQILTAYGTEFGFDEETAETFSNGIYQELREKMLYSVLEAATLTVEQTESGAVEYGEQAAGYGNEAVEYVDESGVRYHMYLDNQKPGN